MKHRRVVERGKSLARSYDDVIVSAGSAGCVVACRLVDGTDATVVLLGAGASDEGPAQRRRLDHADDSLGQHPRAGGYDWRVTITIGWYSADRGPRRHDGCEAESGQLDENRLLALWRLLSVLADQASTAGRYDLAEGLFVPGTQTSPHRKIAGNASF
jgi:choline dehydrogenase-like flavoprotein